MSFETAKIGSAEIIFDKEETEKVLHRAYLFVRMSGLQKFLRAY